MVKVNGQNIPSEMQDLYGQVLEPSVDVKNTSRVKKRYPWQLPHMQSSSPNSPSAAQLAVRAAFKKCTNCFQLQPQSGGWDGSSTGPRGRDWWYQQSLGSGLFYYDYFISQSMPPFLSGQAPDWCKLELLPFTCNTVTKYHPDRTSQYSHIYQAYACYYNLTNPPYWSELFHRWAYFQYDFSQVSPGISTVLLEGCLQNELTFDLNTFTWDYQSGYVYAWHEPYWDPNTLTWNNKPGPQNLLFSRLTPSAWLFEHQENYDISYHSVDITSAALAAINSDSPYLTVVLKIDPEIVGDYGVDVEWVFNHKLVLL